MIMILQLILMNKTMQLKSPKEYCTFSHLLEEQGK